MILNTQLLLRQCHLYMRILNGNLLQSAQKTHILQFWSLHFYIYISNYSISVVGQRRNVTYWLQSSQFFQPICEVAESWGYDSLNCAMLCLHLSVHGKKNLLEHQSWQVTAFKLNNRVGFFTALYFVRQHTSMCRPSLWEQLYFHPFCTHLAWA